MYAYASIGKHTSQSFTALYGIAYMLYTSNLHENAQRVSIYIHESV